MHAATGTSPATMDNLTPSMPTGTEPNSGSRPPAEGWAVAAGHGMQWWSSGWRLFRASPWVWLAITALFLAIMFVLALVPFVGQIASTLLYPVLGAGMLVGARAIDRGDELKVEHLFGCFNAKAVPLIVVALLYYAGWFVIWVIAIGLLAAVVGFGTLASLLSGDPAEAGMALLSAFGIGSLVVVLVAALLGAPLVMAYWFAPALVLFRGDEPLKAMTTSFTACMRNVPPYLVYGLVGLALMVVASIPLALGWLVLLPVFAATIYTSYKDIFGEPA
jgi:uncharacterized membrane protein